ncbi:PKD domain-containing protein [Balneola sp. MJW-20]|uniref:PKD domain-containing protein n=1 Tax=Gracilimonas aurantiaca TaxID=3234185 RepID=UPI00390A9F0C
MRSAGIIILILSCFSISLQGQGLLLWQNGADTVGIGTTDVWIKPDNSSPSEVLLEIYDGDIGGKLDKVTGANRILPSYSLYRFNDLYRLQDGMPVPLNSSPVPVSSARITNSSKYDARWSPLFEIRPGPENGYILRTETPADRFDQLYGLRFGQDRENKGWVILTKDLKAAIVSSGKNDVFQLKQRYSGQDHNKPLLLQSYGNISAYKIDLFGDTTSIDKTEFSPPLYAVNNQWALNIESDQPGIHLFTLKAKDEQPVQWIYDPRNPASLMGSRAVLNETVESRCTEKLYSLSMDELPASYVGKTNWYLNGQPAGTGQLVPIVFERRGPNEIMTVTPGNDPGLLPAYLIRRQSVFINTPPVVEVTVPSDEIYTSELLLLSAQNSYDPEGKKLSYLWYVNGEVKGVDPVFKFSAAEPSIYEIKLLVSDQGSNSECSQTEYFKRIQVKPRSDFDIAIPPFVEPDSSVSVAALIPQQHMNEELVYTWSGDEIETSENQRSFSLRTSQPGNYAISLRVKVPSTGQTYTIERNFRVTSPPDPVMKIPSVAAPGDLITLDASGSTASTDTPLSYEWKINGVTVANTQIATLNLTKPGDYTVQLTVNDGLGLANSTASISKNLHINSPPQPIITGPRISANSVVNFSATESVDAETQSLDYQWEISGEENSTYSGPSITHRFSQSGTYTIRLEVDDTEGLSNSISVIEQTILINQNPVAVFDVPELVAPGQQIRLDASRSYDPDGEIYRYEWLLNGVIRATGERASVSIDEPGEQIISLKIFDNSGDPVAVSLSSATVRVNAPPVPRWKVNVTEVVAGEEIQFDASESIDPDGEITSIEWEFDDGQVLSGETVSRSFDTSGNKNFTLRVSDNEGISNSIVTVRGSTNINNAPAIVTETEIFSNSLDINLDASSSYDLDNDPMNITWSLPDGSRRNEFQFTWKAPGPGIHIIGLQLDDGRGLPNSRSQEMIRVLVNRPVKAVVDSLITACSGKVVLFNSSESYDPDGDPYIVNWEFGDGNSSNEANPAYIYSNPGTYQAKVSMTDGISRQQTVAKIPVIIEGSPFAKMNMQDTTICVNTLLELDATGSSDPSGTLPSLTWEMGDGTIQSGLKTRHIFTEPGTYTLSLIAEGSGSGACSNISQVSAEIRVIEGPQASFELPQWVTPGDEITLDASASTSDMPIDRVEWTIDGDSTQYLEYGMNTSHTFLEAGEYFVTLNLFTTGSGGCNSVSLTRTVNVNAPPELNWNVPDNIAAGEDILLDATGSVDPDGYIADYKWYLDGELISPNVTEILNLTETGSHVLRLEATDNSTAGNNRSILEKEIFVNAAPEARISFGNRKVNVNDVIPLEYNTSTDSDGDPVTASWYVNSRLFTNNELRIDRIQAYSVKLIVDDGRNAANSVDSAMVILNPQNILPSLEPLIPKRIVIGNTLTLEDIQVDPALWRFYQQRSLNRFWEAGSLNDDQIILQYIVNRNAIYEASYNITVLPELAFIEENSVIERQYNPLNPEVILRVPEVNRDIDQVRVRWYRGETLLGKGPLLNYRAQAGTNSIRVEVEDYQVHEAETITRELTINFRE